MAAALLLFCATDALSVELDNREAEITRLRVEGYGLASQLLLNFNPNIDESSPGLPLTSHVRRYREWQSGLSGFGGSRFDSELDSIFSSLQKMNMLDDARTSMLPSIINPILKAHDQIDRVLTNASEATEATDALQVKINRQRIDIARFGFYYQTRLFNGLRSFSDNAGGNLLVDVDAEIKERFLTLDGMIRANDEYLGRSQSNYDFVRRHILESREGWIPEAAILYLNKSIESLAAVQP